MIRLPLVLTVAEAEAIAGALSRTEAMPGYSYGLDARRCRTGSLLRRVPGSTCSGCYACRGWYVQRDAVQEAQALRHLGLRHPRWVDAMVLLIDHYVWLDERGRRFFRWHDSGDLQSVDHLRRIVDVCRRTPSVQHWLPTREYDDVAAFLCAGAQFPENLVVRLSATMIDEAPSVPRDLAHLPTSTVHTVTNPVAAKGSILCHADDDGRTPCESCRACWDPRLTNVSYRRH